LRVLVVLPFPPLPEGSAAARCAVGLLSGLRELGVEPSVLAANIGRVELTGLPEARATEVVALEAPAPWRARIERLTAPKTMLGRGRFLERLRALSEDADIVHLVGAEMAAALPLVSRPALLQLDFLTRRDRRLAGPWTREGRIALELLRAESRTCKRARWMLANSHQVAWELRAMNPRSEVFVAPLALDASYYRPRAELADTTAGLIGMARWPPTRHAVERLLERVWPLVHTRQPEARLLLAGYGMESCRFERAAETGGVVWRAQVPSATDFLRQLGVLLYPLTAGSGTKVKVLEALALGVPVVTTPDGAEGLGAHGGVVVETDDELLAQAAALLLEDRHARELAGEAAYRTFREHHSPAVAAAQVLEIYERIAG
jgi:polysaccharide biosynthesis protein PslH